MYTDDGMPGTNLEIYRDGVWLWIIGDKYERQVMVHFAMLPAIRRALARLADEARKAKRKAKRGKL
jgi:hypothetical protein